MTQWAAPHAGDRKRWGGVKMRTKTNTVRKGEERGGKEGRRCWLDGEVWLTFFGGHVTD